MTRKLLIFATLLCVVALPVSARAEQVTAADLAKKANSTPAADPADPTKDFKGPTDLLNAAKRGDTSAQLDIAILYEYGYNMPDNKVYALAWYILAADSSAKAATHRDKLMSELSAKQVERAKSMSKTLAEAMPKPMPAPQGAPSIPMQAPEESSSPAPEGATPPPTEEPMPTPIPDEAPEKQ